MKKIIILLIFLILFFNTSYWRNTKSIDWMYLSDWYYIWKINWIDLDKNIVKFDNYIKFYGYDSPINDLIDSDYRIYNFSKWIIDYFFILENKHFLEDNKNEKYVIFYVNNYTNNFLESLNKKEVNLKYISFIKCDSNWKIYFDKNWYKVFPMWWTEQNEEYIRKKLGKLNSCKNLEDFFSYNKKFYFSLERQIDFRLYYFILFSIIIYILIFIFKRIIRRIRKNT